MSNGLAAMILSQTGSSNLFSQIIPASGSPTAETEKEDACLQEPMESLN
jgi:hypothetical protein